VTEAPLSELVVALRRFAEERDWDQFHSPKNLSAALAVEAGEILENFQWLTDEQSRNLPPAAKERVELELADVFLYLLRLSDRLDVDLMSAARRKLRLNAEKYPVERARGTARKYTDL
jgi:dCTP diphosphatase